MAGEQTGERFRELVLPHLDDALSLARWLTRNITDAEDVVQDACIRALRALGTQTIGNPRAWLLAIVRNTTFTWLGKNRPKALVVTDDDETFERAGLERVESYDATPEAELIAKADAEQLHRAIAALPLAYREALVLREIEGLSYQEISSVMSIPIGTVDLADAGFPLVGGRADVVDGHPVPTIVYKHREHVISLTAVPKPGSKDDGGPATHATRDGYSLLVWPGRDFSYSAVSDVAPSELEEFAARWRGGAAGK